MIESERLGRWIPRPPEVPNSVTTGKRAEELAEVYKAIFNIGETGAELIKSLLEKYGQEVRKAAANIAGSYPFTETDVADAIGRMPLP